MPDSLKLRSLKLELHAVEHMHIFNNEYYFKPIKPYAITITPIGNKISAEVMRKRINCYLKNQTCIIITETTNTHHYHGIIWLPFLTDMNFTYPIPPNFAEPNIQVKLVQMNRPRGWLAYMYKDKPKFNLIYHNGVNIQYSKYPKKTKDTKKRNNLHKCVTIVKKKPHKII